MRPTELWKRPPGGPVKLWGYDLETYLTRPGLIAPKPVCGAWADETGEWVGVASDAIAFFEWALKRGDHLVGSFLSFDIVVIAAHRPDLIPLIFKAGNAGQFHDVGIRQALDDIANGCLEEKGEDGVVRYPLSLLCKRILGIDISAEKEGDVWRFKYAQLDGKPIEEYPPEATQYMRNDVRRPYDICVLQKNHKNKHDEPAQMRASIAIQFMCAWGFRTDAEYLADLGGKIDAIWLEARTEFAAAGLFRVEKGKFTKNTKALQAAVERAYKAMGAPVPMTGKSARFPGGQIATDRDTLEESGDPILVKLGTSGKNDKRKSTYIPALMKGAGAPINPEFNIVVNTGRVSSDWQQLPQKGGLREAVVSRGHLRRLTDIALSKFQCPDTVICSLDYGGLELRTMSQRAIFEVGFSKMAEFINEGRDPHCHVGAYFEGTTYEEFFARYKAGDPIAKVYRGLAKIFNFGKGGGMGAGAMTFNARVKDGVRFCQTLKRAASCGIRKQETWVKGSRKMVCCACIAVAKELGEMWLEAWPEQKALFAKAGRLTAGKRRVDAVVFGSKRVRGKCTYTQWLNTPFQGAGGDGCKAAMWKIAEEAYTDRGSPLWGTKVFLNIHDELLLEIPWANRHTASYRAAQIMIEVMNAITPGAQNEVKPAIMRRLFKAADEVLDKSGNLAPWWPKGKGCSGPTSHASENCGCWKWGPDQKQMWEDIGTWKQAA